eukprot:8653641-Heterocapsa_arctica.AAC.1
MLRKLAAKGRSEPESNEEGLSDTACGSCAWAIAAAFNSSASAADSKAGVSIMCRCSEFEN